MRVSAKLIWVGGLLLCLLVWLVVTLAATGNLP